MCFYALITQISPSCFIIRTIKTTLLFIKHLKYKMGTKLKKKSDPDNKKIGSQKKEISNIYTLVKR